MKNRVIVIGYLGNMGKRYTAILDSLNVPWVGIEYGGSHFDRQRGEFVSELDTNAYHSILLCTPTRTHIELIKKYRNLNLPILCEKPVSFNLEDIQWIANNKIPVKMVNQYQYLQGSGGMTFYDYYNSGQDGLKWDCINIIGLAGQERARISNSSLNWSCTINGKKLDRDMVDSAYVEMIKDWMENPKPDLEYMLNAHKRVIEGFYEESSNRNTGKIDQHETAGKNMDDVKRQKDTGQGSKRVPEDSSVRRGSKRTHSKRSSVGAE